MIDIYTYPDKSCMTTRIKLPNPVKLGMVRHPTPF